MAPSPTSNISPSNASRTNALHAVSAPEERNRLIVPDILANAGGVTVSYYEWVQNKTGQYWELDDVNNRLSKNMAKEYNAIFSLKEEKAIDMRTVAYVHALRRLGEAIESKGTRVYFSANIQ